MGGSKALIIGAGVAGLSAGSYLQRNGYQTEIFEAHSVPGGLCIAWRRGDYVFDYCIHWLMGTKPGTSFARVWQELGALQNADGQPMPIRNFEEFTRIEISDGAEVRFYADADRLGAELLRVAPEDRRRIRKLVRGLKRCAGFEFPVDTTGWSRLDWARFAVRNLPALLDLRSTMTTRMDAYAARWKSLRMREALTCLIPGSWSVAALLFGLAMQHVQAAGYPVGGSLAFARNIERRYLELGGRIHYRSRVEKILVQDGRAYGLRLADGTEVFGDDIVSAADGHTTLFSMLDGHFLTPKLREAYEEFSLFPSSVFVGFGVARDLAHLSHALVFPLPEPLALPDGSEHRYLSVNVYSFDPTLAPAGKTSVTVMLNTWNDAYWRELAAKDRAAYDRAKADIGQRVQAALETRFPEIAGAVETVDVSTPHTVHRYTGNWHGSYEGFAPTPKTMMTQLPKRIEGLERFHMIGQWTVPGGGLPPAAKDGRDLALRLCKRDGKRFVAEPR